MSKKLFCALSVVLACSSFGYAEDKPAENVKDGKETVTANKVDPTANPTLISSNKIIGSSIYDYNEEAIATVDTILLDHEGKAHYVIAGVGGVAGVGQSQVVIPCQAIHTQCEMKGEEAKCWLRLNISAAKLKQAPVVKTDRYAELGDEAWMETSNAFYRENVKGYDVKVSKDVNQAIANEVDRDEQVSKSGADFICVATVTDASINGTGGESVGQLDAVMFNTENNKAEIAIVGDGGTLGLGETYHALPFTALRFTKDRDGNPQVGFNGTVAKVNNAPKVTPDNYPELRLKSVRDSVKEASTN